MLLKLDDQMIFEGHAGRGPETIQYTVRGLPFDEEIRVFLRGSRDPHPTAPDPNTRQWWTVQRRTNGEWGEPAGNYETATSARVFIGSMSV